MKIKKLFTSLALTAVIAAFITPNVMAAEKSNQIFRDEIIVTPYWYHTTEVEPTISFSSNKYSGYILGNSNVTKISMTVVLLVKNSNGTYSEVSRTSTTSNANTAFKSNIYSYTKGKTYKLTVYGTVYEGSDYESVENSIISTY